MKVTLNKTDNVNGIIAIDLEKTDYQDKVEKSLNQFRQKANIPGFRQGKVPKGVIQKMYGKSVLAEEINKLVSNELYSYIKDNNLNILGEPLPNETEQKTIDFDKDDSFEFKFDIGLVPEFELSFDENQPLTLYDVKIEKELIEKQLDYYKQNFGTYKKIEEKSVESDMIKGVITELENGQPKENGLVIEDGIILPSYIKDEETRNRFIGVNTGDVIVFNPKTAYDNHAAEIASLLHVTKEEVENINSDFSFELKEITRFENAELNQELFDKVFGEGNVTTEEEFKTKVEEILSNQIQPAADNFFMKSARESILNQLKDVNFPEAFLKRWLVVANENNTEEKIENEFPKILEDLKFHLAKEKIAKEQDIKVEKTDVEELAAKIARSQFAQYGMSNIADDMLDRYVASMLSDQNTSRNIYDQVVEDKVREWIKSIAKIDKIEILSKELDKLYEESEKTTEVKENQGEA